jgi:RND family efflux transporter MFP subunit
MNMIPVPTDDVVPHGADQATAVLDPHEQRRRRRTARLLGVGVLVVVGGLIGIGAWSHAAERASAVAALNERWAAVPMVRTAAVQAVDAPRRLDLPGTIQAFNSATLYARATGYIGTRNVDIGSRVKAGDVLAVIAAPELDQQLGQARGQLAQMQAAVTQAVANMDLAQATNNRTARLVQDGWTSKQQGDNDRLGLVSKAAAVAVAQANLQAQQAAVSRLEQLTGFERVIAPFSGVITARLVDVGSLVAADATSGSPLFSIDRTDVLRVQIYVPQDAFFGLKDGNPAEVTVPELPGRVFHGTVARTASSLQQQTRTLLTEVDVDNADGTLTAGLYGVVHLQEPRAEPVVLVPSQAVMFDKDGLSAAVLEDGAARLRHLDLEADDGAQVAVRSGLRPGELLILNPPVGVTDGMKVTTMNPANAFAARPRLDEISKGR